MKIIGATIVASAFVSASAFTSTSTIGRPDLSLNASAIAKTRKQIAGLTKDNFESTLKEVEPFLLNDAGASFYAKSVKRIGAQAKALGVEVPADFAKDAKATKKRRERQDAYVKAKIAEAADAVEEEPAEEAAAEEGEASE
ncbi:unnamed protein product [Pseudo-nitzschia multistriata]|uniref:Uncharacterized protein n=1 Tax=Pseudo-nitzschia multistriata TaxID=183589 RepID=A0A448Z7C6_9STRA|nr:unnamed protein product [Pseudo-nitzschia multistriata]